MINQSDIMSYITDVERFIKYFEKSWKKDVKTTNAKILGSLPLTRANDARIRKMVVNTENIFKKYTADMTSKFNELDAMGEAYRQGVVEDEVIIKICDIMENMVSELRMEHILKLPKQDQTIRSLAPQNVTEILTRWKRRRSQLPSIKIKKIEEPLLQRQEELESWNLTKGNLQNEAKAVSVKIAASNDNLISKKDALDSASTIAEEFANKWSILKNETIPQIEEYEAEIRRLQAEKDSLDLNKTQYDLSQATATYNSSISTAQEKVEQLNTQLRQQKAEEALAIEKAEKAFLFKKKKQEAVAELSVKVGDTQKELDASVAELEMYKSQKETVLTSLNAKIIDIKSNLDALNSQINNVTENKKAAELQIFQAEREYESKALAKKQAEKAYEDERKVLAVLEKELEKINKSIKEADEKIQVLSKEIEGYYQEIAKIKEAAEIAREKAEKRIQNEADEQRRIAEYEQAEAERRRAEEHAILEREELEKIESERRLAEMRVLQVQKEQQEAKEKQQIEQARTDNQDSSAIISGAGRPAHDRTAIIEELKRRYPNGSEFTSADDLFDANPDLASKKKTLANTAKESFGMPLGKYLLSIGLISSPRNRKSTCESAQKNLDDILIFLKHRYSSEKQFPATLTELLRDNPELSAAAINKWLKEVCTHSKTCAEWLKENGYIVEKDWNKDLDEFVVNLRKGLKENFFVPDSIKKLSASFPDLNFKHAQKCVKHIYEKTLEQYLQEIGLLIDPSAEITDNILCYNYFTTEFGVIISKYSGNNENVVVPENIEGRVVIAIGSKAFERSSYFGVFNNNLTSIEIPKNVIYIANDLFGEFDYQFEDIVFVVESNSEAEHFAHKYKFENGTSIKVKIKGIETIDDIDSIYALSFEKRDGVMWAEISSNAQYHYKKDYLQIPTKYGTEDVVGMSFSEWQWPTSIRKVIIPQTTRLIEPSQYTYCNINQIVVDKNNPYLWSDGKALYTKDRKTLIQMFDFEIEEYVVENGTELIGPGAFGSCQVLKKIKLPSSIREIGKEAFYNCFELSDILGIENASIVGDAALKDTTFAKGKKEIIIGTTLVKCKVLDQKKYIIPEGITHISEECFDLLGEDSSDQDILEEIVMPDSVVFVGKKAFAWRRKLKKINFSKSLANFSVFWFAFFEDIDEISLPASLREIEIAEVETVKEFPQIHIKNHGFNAFGLFKKVKIDQDNPTYATLDGVVYSKDFTELISVPVGINLKKLVIPKTVVRIYPFAFYNNQNIEEVVLPPNVIKIEHKSFANCEKLKHINLENVQEIECAAFMECKQLNNIEIPLVSVVEAYTFSGCKKLSRIELSSSLSEIKYSAFSECAFGNFTVPKTVKKVWVEALSGCRDITVYDSIDTGIRPCVLPKYYHSNGIPNYYEGANSHIGLVAAGMQSYTEDDSYTHVINRKWNDYLVTVRSAQTDEIKYQVWMGADPGQRQYQEAISAAWGNNASFLFAVQDKSFSAIKGAVHKLKIALLRLKYKIDLPEDSEKTYLAYISRSAKDAICYCIDNSDMELLEFCVTLGTIKKSNIDFLIEYANTTQRIEFQAYLMNYKNENFNSAFKSFRL